MSYPGLWGYLAWGFIHSSAKSIAIRYKDQDLPGKIAGHAQGYMKRMCGYLSCGACKIHCNLNMAQFPPIFNTPDDYWLYTVAFHNRVNERTGKIQVSVAESEAYLLKMLSNHGVDFSKLDDAFLMDFWIGLILTTFTFCKNPDQATDEEKTEYRAFLNDFFVVAPFGNKRVGERLVHDILVEKVATASINTRDEAFDAITQFHNEVCMFFNVMPKTIKEMKEEFSKRFDQKTSIDVARSMQTREEDHKKMAELQQELHQLKSNISDGSVKMCDCSAYQMSTMVLAAVLAMVFIGLFVWFVNKKQKLWKNEQKTSRAYRHMDRASRRFANLAT